VIAWTVCTADARWPWWQGLAEPDFLAPAEREKLAGLRFPKRRREWLLGRRTAKSLLQGSDAACARLSPQDIAVGNDPGGAPYFTVSGRGRHPASLSISHRDTLAFCALAPAGSQLSVGADVERVETRSRGFVQDFFTAREVERVWACSPERRDALVTLIWSLKEAVLKALRLGLRVDTRRVEVQDVIGFDSMPGAAPSWQPARVGAREFAAWWRPYGDYVLTLAVTTRENEENEQINK